MSKGLRLAAVVGAMVLCLGSLNSLADSQHATRKPKAKKPAPADLPSGSTGRPVPQVPLDSISPVLPQVSFQNGQLTIVAPNSTLAEVLRAVKKQTGAEIEIPSATDRVVTRLGPGPARDVMAELLNGSRFNYVLLGSPDDANALTRVVLVAKSGPENAPSAPQPTMQPQAPSQDAEAQIPPQPASEENNDAEAADDSGDENTNGEAAAEAEQPAQPQDQQGIKTPQQMLQEMQQRQLQMQQQQQQRQPGQPPAYGPGVPPPQAQPQNQPQQQQP